MLLFISFKSVQNEKKQNQTQTNWTLRNCLIKVFKGSKDSAKNDPKNVIEKKIGLAQNCKTQN